VGDLSLGYLHTSARPACSDEEHFLYGCIYNCVCVYEAQGDDRAVCVHDTCSYIKMLSPEKQGKRSLLQSRLLISRI
jgi:hypothetical protein